MKNWLTTLIGGATAVGTYLAHGTVGTLQQIGNIIQIVGVFLLGSAAKDAGNKS